MSAIMSTLLFIQLMSNFVEVLDAGGDGSFASSRGGTVPECLMIAIVRSTGNSDKMKVLTVPYVWPCGDFP